MTEHDTATQINPTATEATGEAQNLQGTAAQIDPASPTGGQAQGPNSVDRSKMSNAERIAALENQNAHLARLIEGGAAGTVPVMVAVQREGKRVDETVQVPIGEFLIGLSNKVGYAHRMR